jgi:two-component system OmpR family sensor kinase/two-component system sensor histidine kinase BaeS
MSFWTLRTKLVGLFALLVIAGAAVTLVATSVSTHVQFDRYVLASDQRRAATLADILAAYYETTGSWAGVDRFLAPRPHAMDPSGGMMSQMMGPAPGRIGPPPPGGTERIVLAAPDGTLLADTSPLDSLNITADAIRHGAAVTVQGAIVGRVLVGSMVNRELSPMQRDFLSAARVSVILSSLTVALLASILGALFLSGITRPLLALTRAADSLASGERGVVIPETRNDEIGRLARSFARMQKTIDAEEQSRRRLFRDVAHELRTPVTLLQGEIEAMLDGVYDTNPERLSSLLEEVGILSRLITDVQLLAALDAQELSLKVETVAAGEILRQAVRPFSAECESRGIQTEMRIADALPDVQADRVRMVQVIGNLLRNALDHGKELDRIELEAESWNESGSPDGAGEARTVALRVRDNGCGIHPSELDRVFDRLYRAHGSTDRSSGSGLGLSIARKIVEAHGGTITVLSRPGEGTTFTILLPV